MEEERSLLESSSWALATVTTVMVLFSFFIHSFFKWFGKWLDTSGTKALPRAFEKIKEELMLFGFLSLLMGHSTIWVSTICVRHSAISHRFAPCAVKDNTNENRPVERMLIESMHSLNHSIIQKREKIQRDDKYCPEGLEPFASYESLEQLHRLFFVLAITHVSYSFNSIALAILKIKSWKIWESEARSMAVDESKGSSGITTGNSRSLSVSTVIFHHTSHPWSQHKYLVWMLCFFRQFWSSANKSEYMTLRLGFLSNHALHMSYNFHTYILRSMEDEFLDIVGISVPLWVYAILCIFLDFHGAVSYFWVSFTPVIVLLLVGTKMHRIMVKLTIEITDATPSLGNQFNLRDELFWFGRPQILLQFIQLVLFQNSFEMATFIWSWWEIKGPSCFMDNNVCMAIRLTSGIIVQCWCSYVTLPLYVILSQMRSRYKNVVSENVRLALEGWSTRGREKLRHGHSTRSSTSSNSQLDEMTDSPGAALIRLSNRFSRFRKT